MSGAFETHLREAIALNRERLPLYAQLTDGASLPISRRLIRAELLALPLARYFDRRAQPYERAGIPLLSEAFVSMQETPAFQAPAPLPPPPPVLLSPREARKLAAAVWRAHRRNGFGGASQALKQALGSLAAFPCYACMLRHMLESALRIANLAPDHAAVAQQAGLPSPAALSRRLFWVHLMALGQSASLDRQAAPLQAVGIPIVCQDVPPIPPGGPHPGSGLRPSPPLSHTWERDSRAREAG